MLPLWKKTNTLQYKTHKEEDNGTMWLPSLRGHNEVLVTQEREWRRWHLWHCKGAQNKVKEAWEILVGKSHCHCGYDLMWTFENSQWAKDRSQCQRVDQVVKPQSRFSPSNCQPPLKNKNLLDILYWRSSECRYDFYFTHFIKGT